MGGAGWGGEAPQKAKLAGLEDWICEARRRKELRPKSVSTLGGSILQDLESWWRPVWAKIMSLLWGFWI